MFSKLSLLFLKHRQCPVPGTRLPWQLFSRHSANTIVSKDRFLTDLFLVASRGYAPDNEEYEERLRCIVAPVRDSEEVVGAISIAGPIFHVTGVPPSCPQSVR
jgi:DNA-binding IclR family transcriptional regulator